MSDLSREALRSAVSARTKWVTDPADREVKVILEQDALAVASELGCTLGLVYEVCLEEGICPHRYLRNRDCFSLDQQLRLARSRVAVVGAGGLGGHVIQLLSRLGVGQLVVVDCDVFDETNLNRQALCTTANLGQPKPEEARKHMRTVNPGVEVFPFATRIDDSNIQQLLSGAKVVVDALDNVRDRLLLEKGAKALRIPLVHGALAGLDGQVMTVFPEDRGLKLIYGEGTDNGKDPRRPEAVLGVPALMPSMIATLQAAEVVKILLERGTLLRNTMLFVNLEAGEFQRFVFP